MICLPGGQQHLTHSASLSCFQAEADVHQSVEAYSVFPNHSAIGPLSTRAKLVPRGNDLPAFLPHARVLLPI